MKGVRCSWVDMQRIREALAAGARGDQKRLEHMRCVDHATVSAWKAVCDLMNALEGKCLISNKERFQPSHAAELARHFRKRERNSSRWTEAMKEEIVDWIERVEAEGLTVREVREQLGKASCPVQSQDKGCTPATLQELLDAGQRFGCIYADPPWQYGNQATRAATSNHYQTMPTEEIAALPVKALAADLAH